MTLGASIECQPNWRIENTVSLVIVSVPAETVALNEIRSFNSLGVRCNSRRVLGAESNGTSKYLET